MNSKKKKNRLKIAVSLFLSLIFVFSFAGCKKPDDGYSLYRDVVRIDDNYRNYYEIYVGSFADGDGDGKGDLKGVLQNLDYLNDGDDQTMDDLGITGIWLMPISPSPSYHKYDVTDYTDVDEAYGTVEDFKALAAECKSRGIKLIIDLVLNHSSSRHPWFVSAKQAVLTGGESPFKEFYNFSNTHQNGYNELGGGYYYESNFSTDMPDFNLDNLQLRAEIEKIAEFWLNAGADGFRLDAVKWAYGEYNKDFEFWKWFSDTVKEIDNDAYLVGEVWDSDSKIVQYYDMGLDSLFAFGMSSPTGEIASTVNRSSYTGKNWAEYNVKTINALKAKNDKAIYAPFFSNHDQGRSFGYVRNEAMRAKFAASLYLTLPGNPFIYYGEELGMKSFGNKDENKRTAFIWGDKAKECMNPLGTDAFTEDTVSAAVQLKDANSLLSHYRHVLRLRDENPELARGDMEALDVGNENIAAYSLTYAGKTIYVFHNADKAVVENSTELDVSSYGSLTGYITCNGGKVTVKDGKIIMPKFSTAIIR